MRAIDYVTSAVITAGVFAAGWFLGGYTEFLTDKKMKEETEPEGEKDPEKIIAKTLKQLQAELKAEGFNCKIMGGITRWTAEGEDAEN